MKSASPIRIGVDIGGTFTDFVIFWPGTGELEAFKLQSTPRAPAEAVLEGLRRIMDKLPGVDYYLIHGSTVATNALLERKGAKTALIATRGFRDVLEIGRQNRPTLYDFAVDKPPPLVPDPFRMEVNERVSQEGRVLIPLDLAQLEPLVASLQSSAVESVAVCLLFSFLHPDHEQAIASRLRTAGFFVSPSSEILPEFREYERTSTTVVNAYVSPILDRYLSHLEGSLAWPGVSNLGVEKTHLRVMQSNGGIISLSEARNNGVRCILSGPAGGVVGARYIAEKVIGDGIGLVMKLISFDMGGTSTDVSLLDGTPRITSESVVGGQPIRIPVIDIHTIGAGGGSIASVDPGGALRVGPESAGADPGPACYARGDLTDSLPTVTDANLVLGRLDENYFLGGTMPLEASRAWHVLSRLGEALGMDPVQTALGIIEVANAHMERALRVISVERGYDPRDFTLLSFGGAGGLHAADLARRIGILHVLVPPQASTLSALGMLAADVIKDYTQTVMFPHETPTYAIQSALEPLVQRGKHDVQNEGISLMDIRVDRLLDMRYLGQSYELTIPFSENIWDDFHQVHRQTYRFDRPQDPLEIVNVRARVTGHVPSIPLFPQPIGDPDPFSARINQRAVVFPSGEMEIPFYRGEFLKPGNVITGPAVVARADTTILVGPSDEAKVDSYFNLHITIGD